MKSLGSYGHNPRTKLNETHSKMDNEVHELTYELIDLNYFSMGTTKVTSHIPGYNGYLPKTDLNPVALEHGSGSVPRETIIKQNIVENY